MLLAQDQTWQLVREGGPFVIAFVALIVGIGVFWKIAGKPSLEALLTISANFAKAADKLEQTTNRLDSVTERLESHEGSHR